jgi:hypothetical protein
MRNLPDFSTLEARNAQKLRVGDIVFSSGLVTPDLPKTRFRIRVSLQRYHKFFKVRRPFRGWRRCTEFSANCLILRLRMNAAHRFSITLILASSPSPRPETAASSSDHPRYPTPRDGGSRRFSSTLTWHEFPPRSRLVTGRYRLLLRLRLAALPMSRVGSGSSVPS